MYLSITSIKGMRGPNDPLYYDDGLSNAKSWMS